MESKTRPLSSKPVTSIPLYTDQAEPQLNTIQMANSFQPYLNKGKPKLNQIMPELPSFGIKSNSTAMLYSKFVVKGLKEDKLSVVKSALKKKQQITETGTTYQNQANKTTRTFTHQKTIENGQIFEVQPECNALQSNTSFLQINNLVRASSAKTFKKAKYQQYSDRVERGLFKNSTQANLHKSRKRPTTATAISKQKQQNQPNQNQIYAGKKPRPTTASSSKRKTVIPRYSYCEFDRLDEIVARKIKDKPIKVQDSKGIDYIQRNIQNLNSYSRKISSIYLTAANIQNLVSNRKKSSKFPSQMLESKTKKANDENINNQLQLKPQQLFVKPDKQKHEKSMKKIEDYLIETTPSKFQLVSEQLKKQERKNKVIDNYQQLLSKDLDNHFRDVHEQMNQKSAKACFEDYIQSCDVMQYNIASKLKPIQEKEQVRNTLNIWECQRILDLFKEQLNQRIQSKKIQKINQIRQITKNLKYFTHKSKQQIDRLFTVPFQIVIAEEGALLIQPNTPVESIYIILNGSVVAQSLISSNSQTDISGFIHHSQVSLYDGENFGQISRPSQNLYKIRVTALEQSLLMKIKYSDYINILLQGNEIQQKLQILKLAFKSQLNSEMMTQEDLEMISFSLQKHKYPAKSLIFRQGEIYDKLVIVAKGKVAAISQYILEQNKTQQKDMKKINQMIKQQPQQFILKKQQSTSRLSHKNRNSQDRERVALSDMRRDNLINYEVVRQNNKKLYYYFMKQQSEFVKGDTVNWEPILNSFSIPVPSNAMEESITAIFNLGLNFIAKPTRFSLISNTDDTQIYTLSSHAFQYLPNQLKKTILQKGKQNIKNQIKVESTKEIKEWNEYKNKLCDQILKDKKQRASKMRL